VFLLRSLIKRQVHLLVDDKFLEKLALEGLNRRALILNEENI